MEADSAARPPDNQGGLSLPVGGLLALAMTGFVAIMAETLPAGLLPAIGKGLGVSQAGAGQLVTFYAAGSLIAAIPLTAATLGWRRRRVLLIAIIGLLIFNTITAVSSLYLLTLGARFLAGISAGLAWGIIAGYARRMVSGPLQGRALALAMIGTPLALSLGVPAGVFFGELAGWRLTFAVMSVLTLGLVGWVLLAVPDFDGQSPQHRAPIRAVFVTPGLRPVLLVIVLWMLAHNVLYTYVYALVSRAGLGGRVDLVLLDFGLAAIVSIWFVGLIVDTHLRTSLLLSLSIFGLAAAALLIDGRSPVVIYTAVAVWGLTFGGAATLLGTAGADAAGDDVDLAQAMNTTAWNAAIAGGGLFGGILLTRFGAGSLPWAVLTFVLLALGVAWEAEKHSFPPGPRRAPHENQISLSNPS